MKGVGRISLPAKQATIREKRQRRGHLFRAILVEDSSSKIKKIQTGLKEAVVAQGGSVFPCLQIVELMQKCQA